VRSRGMNNINEATPFGREREMAEGQHHPAIATREIVRAFALDFESRLNRRITVCGSGERWSRVLNVAGPEGAREKYRSNRRSRQRKGRECKFSPSIKNTLILL
jgi:hypothetical protein